MPLSLVSPESLMTCFHRVCRVWFPQNASVSRFPRVFSHDLFPQSLSGLVSPECLCLSRLVSPSQSFRAYVPRVSYVCFRSRSHFYRVLLDLSCLFLPKFLGFTFVYEFPGPPRVSYSLSCFVSPDESFRCCIYSWKSLLFPQNLFLVVFF